MTTRPLAARFSSGAGAAGQAAPRARSTGTARRRTLLGPISSNRRGHGARCAAAERVVAAARGLAPIICAKRPRGPLCVYDGFHLPLRRPPSPGPRRWCRASWRLARASSEATCFGGAMHDSQSDLPRAARGARSLRSENKELGSKSDRNLIGPCLSLRCSGGSSYFLEGLPGGAPPPSVVGGVPPSLVPLPWAFSFL